MLWLWDYYFLSDPRHSFSLNFIVFHLCPALVWFFLLLFQKLEIIYVLVLKNNYHRRPVENLFNCLHEDNGGRKKASVLCELWCESMVSTLCKQVESRAVERGRKPRALQNTFLSFYSASKERGSRDVPIWNHNSKLRNVGRLRQGRDGNSGREK